MAIVSNEGTAATWSPYLGDVVQDAITFHQNNVWRNNSYDGAWKYVLFETSNRTSWYTWRASPFNQDSGSTITTGSR
jgi:hypothetical protein